MYLANVFWIVSLIFSTGSAIQSQLAFYWLQHPRHQFSWITPPLAAETIRRAPIFLFVISIISFSGGLISYTYAAFGDTALPSVAVACTTLTLTMFFMSALWRIIDGIRWIQGQGAPLDGVLGSGAPSSDPVKQRLFGGFWPIGHDQERHQEHDPEKNPGAYPKSVSPA